MKRAILAAAVALAVAKGLVAARLELFGDEAFYWQCGQRPALAYADHPPVTALLVRLGTELLGDTAFGVRLLFLLAGAALPAAVYLLARPLVGERDAGWAAGAALAVPAVAWLGLLAVPDAPMVLLAALFFAGFERATRTGARRAWLLTGLAGAAGLATHYRFALAPAAALAYLALAPGGRRLWRGRGPWWMLAALAAGLVPGAVYNLRADFEPLRYYLAGRHAPRFDAGALGEHLAAQALLVTPLLYAALLGVLVALCRRALGGDDRAALAALFALAHLGTFFLASPFDASELVTAHWPAPGYLALLPYLPAALRGFAARGGGWRRLAAPLAPGLGAAVMVVLLAELGTGRPGLGAVREPFVGVSEAVERTRALLPRVRPAADGRRLVVADNYKLGAQLERALAGGVDLYVLDHHKNRQHGRAPQLAAWGIDEAGLRRRAGEEALVVIEASQTRTGEHEAWLAHAASFFGRLEPLGELEVASPGKRKKVKVYRFYRGRERGARSPAGGAALNSRGAP